MERDDLVAAPMTPEQPALGDPPAQARPAGRCPRCGAMMGALRSGAPGADPSAATADAYCGCCGLVLPDAG